MTIEELVESHGLALAYFEDNLWPRPGIYIEEIGVIFVNRSLSKEAMKRVVYHELGHLDHTTALYENNRTKCENEANRNMIHHLMKAELDECEDKEQFNYLHFMEKYKLKTITDEVMVKEEFKNLARIG